MHDLPELALSIRQPWAWAILHAGKDIENRDWRTKFRGPICLHAAKGLKLAEYRDGRDAIADITMGRRDTDGMPLARIDLPGVDEFDFGGIVGVAEIVDCVAHSTSPWFFGSFGLVLANVRPVPFIPVKGALGFFKWRGREI